MQIRAWIVFGSVALSGIACNAILGLDGYRACTDETPCTDAATADTSTDTMVEAGSACTTSSECTITTPACSRGFCTGVTSLLRGSTNHECVILQDGAMWCWGDNSSAELGRSTSGGSDYQAKPVTVLNGASVLTAAIGVNFGCAITIDNVVHCWGTGPAGSGTPAAEIVQLSGTPVQLTAGQQSACATMAGGQVYCWGNNDYADIGCAADASTAVSLVAPQLLANNLSTAARHTQQGLYASCAGSGGSKVKCWGDNTWGDLGIGSAGDVQCGTSEVDMGGTFSSIDGSDFAMCATDDSGGAHCWGMNYAYNGIGLLWPAFKVDTINTPTLMPYPVGTTNVSIGWLHTCTTNGIVTCWGQSDHYQTGIYGAPGTAVFPRAIDGLTNVANIAAHRHFTCALQDDGQVLCWGNNEYQTVGPTSASQYAAGNAAYIYPPIPVTW